MIRIPVKLFRILINYFFSDSVKSLPERYPQYSIGPESYGDLTVFTWGENAKLVVGNYTSIAAGVKVLLGGEHRTDWVTTYPFNVLWSMAKNIEGHPRTKGDVIIGNDVWIGTEALICSGVTIGDGAVIGARAVVTKNVPPYAIVAGNPAKIVKFRFEEEVIEELLKLQWWNWDKTRIENAMLNLLNTDIHGFIDSVKASKL